MLGQTVFISRNVFDIQGLIQRPERPERFKSSRIPGHDALHLTPCIKRVDHLR